MFIKKSFVVDDNEKKESNQWGEIAYVLCLEDDMCMQTVTSPCTFGNSPEIDHKCNKRAPFQIENKHLHFISVRCIFNVSSKYRTEANHIVRAHTNSPFSDRATVSRWAFNVQWISVLSSKPLSIRLHNTHWMHMKLLKQKQQNRIVYGERWVYCACAFFPYLLHLTCLCDMFFLRFVYLYLPPLVLMYYFATTDQV